MKKINLFKSYTTKNIVRFVVLYLIIVLVWIWFFNVTATATTNNTYVDTIEAVRVKKIGYPIFYRNILIVYTHDDKYIMDLGGSSTDIIESVLLTEGNTVKVTIREHLPQYVHYSFWVKQIVNLQDEDNTVWSIEKHNNIQRTQRIYGLIGFSFVTIILVLMSLIWGHVTFFDAIKRKYRRYKKKQKKQFKDATKGYSEAQKRILHDEFSGKGLGYSALKKGIKDILYFIFGYIALNEE